MDLEICSDLLIETQLPNIVSAISIIQYVYMTIFKPL